MARTNKSRNHIMSWTSLSWWFHPLGHYGTECDPCTNIVVNRLMRKNKLAYLSSGISSYDIKVYKLMKFYWENPDKLPYLNELHLQAVKPAENERTSGVASFH